jgi:hypothetical protein
MLKKYKSKLAASHGPHRTRLSRVFAKIVSKQKTGVLPLHKVALLHTPVFFYKKSARKRNLAFSIYPVK